MISLKKWDFNRILRILMGAAIIIQSIVEKEIIFGLVGAAFIGMAIFNKSCCGSGTCNINTVNKNVKGDTLQDKDV
jgi:hypothetical protein